MSDILLQPVQDNNIEKTLTIYQKYNYLINKKISLYSGYNNSSADDLKNEIALSIYKAVSKYPDSGTFPIYLNKTIDRTLLNHLRKINNKKDKVYQESIKTDNDQDFQDNRYNPEQLFFEISSYNNLKRKIINELTWKEELVFTMREQNFTMEEISPENDKLKLIEKIVNDDGLYALNEYLQSLMPNKKLEVAEELPLEEKFTNIQKESINNPQEASIYRKEAIPLVKQDLINHPLEPINNYSNEPIIEEEQKEYTGPVKKLVNNPWSTAEGIKTVSPGELNLK